MRYYLAMLLLSGVACVPSALASDEFPPVSPAELSMKQYPGSPGATAVILERRVFTDAAEATESHYTRIKILTDEGKKYADVEIPYSKSWSSVGDIHARTVHPDGTVVPFVGKPFEKEIVRYRTIRVLAKTLSLPDVQVGSVIEYKYTLHNVFSGHWMVQEDLFTHHAHFELKPSSRGTLAFTWAHLPTGERPEKQKNGNLVLDVADVPPFQEEKFTLPEQELKMRVNFFYVAGSPKTPDEFWRKEAETWREVVDRYEGKPASLEHAVAETAPLSDPVPTRLQKLYARVQQLRNVSYETAQSEEENARENLKPNNDAQDVLKHGYGNHWQLNALFVAMARAAGVKAWLVRVSERDDHVFHADVLNDRQFDGSMVMVQDGSQQFYLDPGTYRCPFGLIPWKKTSTAGMVLSKEFTSFVTTSLPKSADAITERTAKLEITGDGTLKGTIQVAFHGQEALSWRIYAHSRDEVSGRKDLEDELKGWLPSSGDVKLVKVTGWDSTDEPLQAELQVSFPGFATRAGHRLILPLGIFEGSDVQFEHAERLNPIYFEYPYQEKDEISIALPSDYHVENLPKGQEINPGGFCNYETKRSQTANAITVHRLFSLNGFFLAADRYPALREFFRKVRSDDESEALVTTTQTHATQ